MPLPPGGSNYEQTYDVFRELSAGVGYAETPFVSDTSGRAFVSKGIVIVNDGAAAVDFGFRKDDTATVILAGRIDAGEVLTFDHRREDRIFVKLRAAGPAVPIRVWVW